MRRLATLLLASSALGLGQAALAADMPAKAPRLAPVAVPWSWTGFYVGGHFGAGWARKQWTDPNAQCEAFLVFPFCPPTNLGSHNAIGPLGGFQAGLNWQDGYLVVGIEAQYSFANLRGDHQSTFASVFDAGDGFVTFNQSNRLSTKIKGIGTIAGRIGLASGPTDRTLFYVKGGAAYVKEDFTEAFDLNFFGCGFGFCGAANFNGNLSASHSRWGWMAGIGLEYGLFDNWSAKVEYNYLDFGQKTVQLDGSACATDGSNTSCIPFSRQREIRQEIHLIKLGLNYRFGGQAAVVARY
jgi:outer membrane immunogenic protein